MLATTAAFVWFHHPTPLLPHVWCSALSCAFFHAWYPVLDLRCSCQPRRLVRSTCCFPPFAALCCLKLLRFTPSPHGVPLHVVAGVPSLHVPPSCLRTALFVSSALMPVCLLLLVAVAFQLSGPLLPHNLVPRPAHRLPDQLAHLAQTCPSTLTSAPSIVIAGGHTASNAPDLFRPPKLSGAGPG